MTLWARRRRSERFSTAIHGYAAQNRLQAILEGLGGIL